jgi:Zn-dependent peptidase ImmA (M78 family)
VTALWAQEVAGRFWRDAGGPPPHFPRDLRTAVAWALPLAVIDLPRLRVGAIDDWLTRRRLNWRVAGPDRAVRACLIARDGGGLIFLDGADPEDDRRYSLAHEVAHFLIEIALPRERALARLGEGIRPVLDGERPPTAAERADALLAHVALGRTLHLLERSPLGMPDRPEVGTAEQRADTLALELLAPADRVQAHLRPPLDLLTAARTLRADFGLPTPVAAAYARRLFPQAARRSLAQLLAPSE